MNLFHPVCHEPSDSRLVVDTHGISKAATSRVFDISTKL